MASSPAAIIIIITFTMVFQALLVGEEYFADSFGEIEELNEECNETGPFAGIKCFFQSTVEFFKIIGAFIKFFFKFVTLDVVTGETPWPVRVIIGTTILVVLVWSIAELFRGN